MSNYNDNKKYGFNNVSYSSKKITQHEKISPVKYEEIKIIGIRPLISKLFHQLAEIQNLHKHSDLVKGNYNTIGNIVKHQV